MQNFDSKRCHLVVKVCILQRFLQKVRLLKVENVSKIKKCVKIMFPWMKRVNKHLNI